MDQELLELVSGGGGKEEYGKTARRIQFVDTAAGEVRVNGRGGQREYRLKPLRELYGEGNHTDVIDPEDDVFMPLFLAIESEIADYYEENPKLTDGAAALVLDQMGMDPEAAPADPLAQRIRMGLRVCLSLNNYSRQEVKAALRKVNKSVDRHTRADGPRGYLDFIVGFFGSGR